MAFSHYTSAAVVPLQCRRDADHPFPTARAYALSSAFGTPGNHMLGVTVHRAATGKRPCGQHGSGDALLVFNLDPNQTP